MKKTAVIIFGLFLILTLSGCSKKQNSGTESNVIELIPSDSSYSELSLNNQNWEITNKRIFVLFGYGFNDENTRKSILEILEKRYGLDGDGGLIYPIFYPDDFKHSIRSYSSELYFKLKDDSRDICGLILLGAPENTHVALARNQDFWNQEVPYPVIALFPQDEVLGLESACDIVLDKGHQAQIAGDTESEEIESSAIEDAPEILIETIDYIKTLNSSLTRDSSIQAHILQMLKGHKIHHYTDPETGLQSINHFVLN